MARIFISHSAKTPPERDYLNAVAAGLTAGDHQVLLDQTALQVSDDWSLRITNWMVDCHGAVVLMSPQALQSDFVKLEISNLLTRWRRNKTFPLCVVLLPGVTASDIRQGFYGAVGLADNQFIVADRSDLALPQLLGRFAVLPASDAPRTAFEALEHQLTSILRGASVAALAGGAVAAGWDCKGCNTVDDFAARLGPFLMRCSMATAFKALREFRRGLSREQTAEVFELIAPTWVPPEAGTELAAIIDDAAAQERRSVIINAAIPEFTPGMYVRRAHAHLPGWSGLVTDAPHARTGTLETESLLYQVRVAIVSKLGEDPEPDAAALEQQVARLLKTYASLGLPVIVPLPIQADQRSLLTELAGRDGFRTVTFIGLCGLAAGALSDDTWLRPELQMQQEENAHNLYEAIKHMIRLER